MKLRQKLYYWIVLVAVISVSEDKMRDKIITAFIVVASIMSTFFMLREFWPQSKIEYCYVETEKKEDPTVNIEYVSYIDQYSAKHMATRHPVIIVYTLKVSKTWAQDPTIASFNTPEEAWAKAEYFNCPRQIQ